MGDYIVIKDKIILGFNKELGVLLVKGYNNAFKYVFQYVI